MKPDNKLRKALLTDEEIQLLLDHYDRIIEDGTKMLKTLNGKPIEGLIANQIAEIQCRRAAIARFTDGRWTNRGTGRRKKETAPSPALPLDAPAKVETVSKDNRPF